MYCSLRSHSGTLMYYREESHSGTLMYCREESHSGTLMYCREESHSGMLMYCSLESHSGTLMYCSLESHSGTLMYCSLESHSGTLMYCREESHSLTEDGQWKADLEKYCNTHLAFLQQNHFHYFLSGIYWWDCFRYQSVHILTQCMMEKSIPVFHYCSECIDDGPCTHHCCKIWLIQACMKRL